MNLGAWLATFRDLHERAKAGKLSQKEAVEYRMAREELARAMLAAHRLSLKPGETPRAALRVARALQVDLDWTVGGTRAMTIDLSAGGIAVLLDKAPPQGEELKYTLRLGGGVTVAGQARVVNVRLQPNNVRVALAFQNVSEADREKLEVEVFDTVLGQLKS